ncbi:cyclophilin-like domain-containing protein [Trametes gibbosa]|nr:cyclophilin-like domain-containing protein [Trametes gibbosa]
MARPRVFFDISIGDQPAGRIVFELYNASAPKTSEKSDCLAFIPIAASLTCLALHSFRALCTGEKGLSPLSERPLYYKNSIVHRSIPGFMLQGGDFTKRNGTGGESIYGGPFPDEDLSRPLDSEGLLCMANKGPNTNNSQFFITLRECPHLNGKHVVFGRVIRGYDIVERMAKVPTDEKDRPATPIVISNCGELMLRAQVPQKKLEARSASESVSDDERHPHKKRRHPSASPDGSRSRSRTREPRPASRSRSRSVDSASPERKRHKSHKKSKHGKKHKSKKDAKTVSPARSGSPHGHPPEPASETESQYDARLEREENDRIEAARKRELERVTRRLKEEEERRTTKSGGVRFKGRGRMKYLDPELQRERT